MRNVIDPLTQKETEFLHVVRQSLRARGESVLTRLKLERIAAEKYGIADRTEVKELTERAIGDIAREICLTPNTVMSYEEKFYQIVELYQRQANISHRSSHSILLQQYSTPIPLSFVMGLFCGVMEEQDGTLFFEPCAGNGLLTVTGNPGRFIVNEIDVGRRRILHSLPFLKIHNVDASQKFPGYIHYFDGVITNPPFGPMKEAVMHNGYKITQLEHLISIHALDCLKNDGRAAIIIGGHTRWDELGRIQAGSNRIFLNYLYAHYNVKDIINVNGKRLYTKQGTGFNIRIILIDGRRREVGGVAPKYDPIKDNVCNHFHELFERVMRNYKSIQRNFSVPKGITSKSKHILSVLKNAGFGTLEAPYLPASKTGISLDTQVPDSMAYEAQQAIERIQTAVGGDIDNYVRHRLGYDTKFELSQVLSAEQIDAVGMAIYNIEARQQGMVIGDQTGIGKGRVAAAIIRYGVLQGVKPIFLTEKANLFSDIYRDLTAIGSEDLRPFIINAKESKTDIKDEDGNVIYQALDNSEQKKVFESGKIPDEFDFCVATYSQFNSASKKPEKPNFLKGIAKGNILILDESHNSSGSSNTGVFMRYVITESKGVTFLSATFAKRPDNMPIYAMKTAIRDCTMRTDELVDAITRGGVALQEVLSSQLVSEGQMIRRERSFEGVEVNYITLDELSVEHSAISDSITEVIRDIITFQKTYVDKVIKELDKEMAEVGREVNVTKGTREAGVDNQPYFSKVFQVINQMLFSLKAESVAEQAIKRLKEGLKPVIAFSNTMGSFIENNDTENDAPVTDGDEIDHDFSEVLYRGLEGILRYTETTPSGRKEYHKLDLSELGKEATREYRQIERRIDSISTGISVSPIDVIVSRLSREGYKVAEVTGRKFELDITPGQRKAIIRARRKINTNDAFRRFNNNEIDVLLINQSGSTGASAHAVPTRKVPPSEVKRRVMIILQAELDINTEVQKRGRINRTGQLFKPIYDYISSSIPAEKRLMMMLQKKLKSLDANTTSNQKQSTKILDVPDFLNKYGNKVVSDYLVDNPEINATLDWPISLSQESTGEDSNLENAAHKVSGRVAVLPAKAQEDFYNDVIQRYSEYVEYLKQIGDYDLEVEDMNLEADLISSSLIKVGKGTGSVFGTDSYLEKISANVLKKPFTVNELDGLIKDSLKSMSAEDIQQDIIDKFESDHSYKREMEYQKVNEQCDRMIADIDDSTSLIIERKINGEIQEVNIMDEIEEYRAGKLELIERDLERRRSSLMLIFKFFHISRLLFVPFRATDQESQLVPAIFLGFKIDFAKPKPFLPSRIGLRIAIANSTKFMVIPASVSSEILGIIGASQAISQPEYDELLRKWDVYTKNSSTDRAIRYMVTGNILQAFSMFRGKLVSYTTKEKEIKKGILLPELWVPKKELDQIQVPVAKSIRLFRSLTSGNKITMDIGASIFRKGDRFKMIVSSSRSKGGDVYLDPQVLDYVEGGNFEKAGSNMACWIAESNIEPILKVMSENHGASITVSRSEFDQISADGFNVESYRSIILPPVVSDEDEDFARRKAIAEDESEVRDESEYLRIRAKALIIKLKLLTYLKAA